MLRIMTGTAADHKCYKLRRVLRSPHKIKSGDTHLYRPFASIVHLRNIRYLTQIIVA